jgi:hypothetical protein
MSGTEQLWVDLDQYMSATGQTRRFDDKPITSSLPLIWGAEVIPILANAEVCYVQNSIN